MTPSIKLLVRVVQETEKTLYTIAVALDYLPEVERRKVPIAEDTMHFRHRTQGPEQHLT